MDYNKFMKKLLLILSLSLALFGCSKDRNYDGVVTISDYGLAFKSIFIAFGEVSVVLINAVVDTGLGRFLELNTLYLSRDGLSTLGAWAFFLFLLFMNLMGYFWRKYMESQDKKLYEAREKVKFEKELESIKKRTKSE